MSDEALTDKMIAENFRLKAELERLKGLWRTMRFTSPSINNSTADWVGAYRDFERAMDEAAGVTREIVRAALEGK